ncbi:MAG: NAD-dependent epimerase/dehydratase family protein [Candidatus Dadabacteria bacterium]|nr:NAD-dependent epimerase/dehydratase family protein [Candidatus Dadabacteria bacterium]MYB26947.1 NAD-dependent epimerase/dehydratase family protein [Candidatus Dadabacteria bacterium]MYI73473.1 NAD-dependent epimerase/dehydratase family protein [Candidatus Dadabacteria bacterium]
MRIIVTGGAGFIGSWVCEAYISEGHEVLVVDNLSTGSEDNIPPEAEFVECDVRDSARLEKAFRQFRPEVVNHHAAQINVRNSVENPSLDADINIGGSLNVLRLSGDHKIGKFIFSSTGGALYGEPKKLPADESTPALPLSPYGISKLSTENYVRYHSRNHGFGHVILRYSNVYGERQNPEGEAGVIGIFCEKIISGKPCLIFGDGEQTRDYVHVSDVSRANLLAATLMQEGTFNIGTSIESSVNDIVDILEEVTKTEFTTVHEKERSGEVRRISLDCSLAAEKFGWSARVALREGLFRTWSWFLQERN